MGETSQEYEAAKKKVEAKLGFTIHLIVYVSVNILLIIINLLTLPAEGTRVYWFIFPLLGWGVGLVLHYVFAIALKGEGLEAWVQKKAGEEVEKAKDQSEGPQE